MCSDRALPRSFAPAFYISATPKLLGGLQCNIFDSYEKKGTEAIAYIRTYRTTHHYDTHNLYIWHEKKNHRKPPTFSGRWSRIAYVSKNPYVVGAN